MSAAFALVAGGATAAVAVSSHYLRAPDFATGGGIGWLPPDNSQAGPYRALVTSARPGHAQTFFVEIYNPASVTQTILGLADDSSQTAEPDHLTVSETRTVRGDAVPARYTSQPVAIAPKAVYRLRFTHDTAADCRPDRSESWTDLRLRVRVGAFTRTETISLGSNVLTLRWPSGPC